MSHHVDMGAAMATESERAVFGGKLRARREQSSYSSRSLAEEMGRRGLSISHASITGYERGESTPPRKTLAVIEEILDTGGELASLLGYETGQSYEDRLFQIERLLGEVVDRLSRLERPARETRRPHR